MNAISSAWRNIRAAVTITFQPRDAGYQFTRESGDYPIGTDPKRSSIVVSCVRWVQRTISEAPPILERYLADKDEWEQVSTHRLLDVLAAPNPSQTGTQVWKATVKDLLLKGNAYWILQRNNMGAPVSFYWMPADKVTPVAGAIFGEIASYRIGQGATEQTLDPADVIHFRDGLDSENAILGESGIGSLINELITDERAASFTQTLMRNSGQPGAVISPESGVTIPQAAAEQIERKWNEKFASNTGAGNAMVTPKKVEIEKLAFSPEQMEMRAQRSIPEERTTAVLGVNAAVVGLGSGLATTKVGATLAEYREEAFESNIIPMYRDLAAHLTQQMLPEFGLRTDGASRWRLTFDLRGVRVLQEDELKRVERICRMVTDGVITIAEGRRMLGLSVLPEHEIYLRPGNLRMIPTGPLLVQTQPPSNDPANDPLAVGVNGAVH